MNIFPLLQMATPRHKKKLLDINGDNHGEHPGKNRARDTNVPRNQEDYFTLVSEEIKGRETKKLFQQFSRTESRILGTRPR